MAVEEAFQWLHVFFHGRSSEAHRAPAGLRDMYGGSKLRKRARGLS